MGKGEGIVFIDFFMLCVCCVRVCVFSFFFLFLPIKNAYTVFFLFFNMAKIFCFVVFFVAHKKLGRVSWGFGVEIKKNENNNIQV